MITANRIKITDIIIYPVAVGKKKKENLLAFVRVVFNDAFLVSGIRILKGKNEEPFLSFPKEVGDDGVGKAWDICYPITAELRTYISEMVIGRWEEVSKPKLICSECGQVIVNKEEQK